MADSGPSTKTALPPQQSYNASTPLPSSALPAPLPSPALPPPLRPVNQTTVPLPTQEWEIQTTRRLEALFFSHTTNEPNGLLMFANLLRQYEDDGKIMNDDVLSRFFLMVSLWGLARIHNVSDFESRRQFGVFINHLQDAETALLKAIQIHHKTLIAKSVPPTRTVQSLPISTTSQL